MLHALHEEEYDYFVEYINSKWIILHIQYEGKIEKE